MSDLVLTVWALLLGAGAGLVWVGDRDANPLPSAAGVVLLVSASGLAAWSFLP